MKIGAISLLSAISLTSGAARILAVMLTACTGRGGGYLPPPSLGTGMLFTGHSVRLQLQLRGRSGMKPNPSKEEES
jgi:hypothetical protein